MLGSAAVQACFWFLRWLLNLKAFKATGAIPKIVKKVGGPKQLQTTHNMRKALLVCTFGGGHSSLHKRASACAGPSTSHSGLRQKADQAGLWQV
jgi:hypothetical protein